jgi:hypothetical protein
MKTRRLTATITRPANATPFTAGDAFGDVNGSAIVTLSLGADAVPGMAVKIASAALRIDLASVPASMTTFRLHLYDAAPTAIADNAVWSLVSGDRDSYLGYVDLGTPVDAGATLYVRTEKLDAIFKAAGNQTNLFGVLVTNGGYTPASGEVAFIDLIALPV